MGRQVILAEYEDHVGGILSNGLTNTDLQVERRTAVGGFFEEFTRRIIEYYRAVDAGTSGAAHVQVARGGWAYEPRVAEAVFQKMLAEQPRVQLMLRHELKTVTMDGQRIAGAVFEPRDTVGRMIRVNAPVVIDATYEGDLAALAKAEYRLGREGRNELGEPHAGLIYMKFGSPELQSGSTGQADKAIQAYCFRFTATTDPFLRVPVEKPARYDRSDYSYLLKDIERGQIARLDQIFGVFPLPGGKVELNSRHPSPVTGVPSESLDLAEECWPWPEATQSQRRRIYERYLAHNVGMLWMLQNDPDIPAALREDSRRYGWCPDEYIGNNHLPRQVYVREGRRIEGEYLLTEHDGELAGELDRTRIQPTSIGLVEWQYDSHACHRFDPDHPGIREGYTYIDHAVFQIPYGVVVPKVIDGLLVPVACSASHVAYNALRMEPVFMALGEACGHAAHLAGTARVPVRSVPVDHLQRALLANGGVITYLDDLPSSDEAFAACQWLGARGFNRGYQAEAGRSVTRGESAERLGRVLQHMSRTWSGGGTGDPSAPLLPEHVMEWLKSAGFEMASRQTNGGLTVGQFATLVYETVATAGTPERQAR